MADLETLEGKKALVAAHAGTWGLDPVIVLAVCDHESSWDTNAVRFEPAFLQRYIIPTMSNLPPTEEMTRAMSFGLMQIMGETARELGFAGKWLTELCTPDVGVEFGCRKLHRCAVTNPPTLDVKTKLLDWSKALLAYNGGGDPDYPKKVLALVPKYQEANNVA